MFLTSIKGNEYVNTKILDFSHKAYLSPGHIFFIGSERFFKKLKQALTIKIYLGKIKENKPHGEKKKLFNIQQSHSPRFTL